MERNFIKAKRYEVFVYFDCECGAEYSFEFENIPSRYSCCCNRELQFEPIQEMTIGVTHRKPVHIPKPKLTVVQENIQHTITKQSVTPESASFVPVSTEPGIRQDCLDALVALGSKKKSENRQIVDAYLAKAETPTLEDFMKRGIAKR